MSEAERLGTIVGQLFPKCAELRAVLIFCQNWPDVILMV